MKDNIFFFLKKKGDVFYLNSSLTIKQGLEEMKKTGYTAIPVIDKEGAYIGSVTEGDFLWYVTQENVDMDKPLKTIIRKDFMPAVSISTSIPDVLQQSLKQNYVPVVDDRNIFIGIITRKAIMEAFLEN
ncbi:CBS domain-containing protein [Floccifex sp.]|uniref:CBS domain-containing protein n=1 Tax=Floccifex sp. TaxID=2815810 RepID=UPI002A75DBC5|nr:CBS domain-containing protein [Floccifex sp.]MDD7281324.1 CBS domain-containing protein [Erysipelotrichaceae bacterium]MDY2958909.1 CBS domain-containing protein [Floccifex sp.]